MQIINEDIKSGQFKPVYLLFGEEDFSYEISDVFFRYDE